VTATKPLPPHGTPAKNLYDKRRRVLLATGRWNPWTDAQPVRDHITALGEAGIGWMRAAELAGLSTATVSHWLYGHNGYPPPRQIRAELAAKMLAVTAAQANLADCALTDSLVTIRQIQTLAADGFPMTYLAARLGQDSTNLSRVMRRARVEAGTARAVADLFAELAGTDPAAAGISARNTAYIRNWAAKKGWFTSREWDGEIGNPDADPAAWARKEKPGRATGALLEDAEFIVRTTGISFRASAGRLGVSRTALEKARERAKAGAA
jgi:hypothetical protein